MTIKQKHLMINTIKAALIYDSSMTTLLETIWLKQLSSPQVKSEL